MSTIWYFPLEIVKSRYTEQLCKRWLPSAVNKFRDKEQNFKVIEGENVPHEINVGCVLDATGRGHYSLSQVNNFLKEIENNNVNNGDIIYLQDFWTPGIEAIQYALDLYNIKDIKIYSMLHAQSVDEYDFTYQMKEWMRPIELGYDKMHNKGGIFVGSSIHKNQLEKAGFTSPIHVVSLPFDINDVYNMISKNEFNTENAIVYSSRFDWEKNPEFMLQIANEFLFRYKDCKFYVTTSANKIRSNKDGIVDKIYKMAEENNRFIIKEGISKDEYYKILCRCKIQLNTSLQDYVSWTLLEATTCGCDIVYPNYRSFPECVPSDRLYKPFVVTEALKIIEDCINNPRTHFDIPEKSNIGRLLEGYIICNGIDENINIWDNKKIDKYKRLIRYEDN
jgi:glycosyltransferase involved in cell wall biosynthesis